VSEAANIGMWMMAASLIGNTILVWVKLSGRSERREIQQPLEVKAHEKFAPLDHHHSEYMTKADCRQFHLDQRASDAERFAHIHHQLEAFGLRLEGALAEHNKQADERANAIHGRITALVPSIAKVEGRLDDHLRQHERTAPHG
jgi:hypothetical protein